MSRRPRWNHSPAFNAKVAIEALGDSKRVAEIAQKRDVPPQPGDRVASPAGGACGRGFGASVAADSVRAGGADGGADTHNQRD